MKKILIFVFCVSISTIGFSQTWQPVTGTVGFTAKMFGVGVEGKFKGLAANIKFDPENPASGNIFATVDATTLDTDNTLRNRHLREKSEFFETDKYQKISMKSVKIEKSGNNYIGYFDLTIKTVTKPIKVPFTFTKTNDKATFSGTSTINRRDWGIGGGTLGMANDVTISLTVNAIQK